MLTRIFFGPEKIGGFDVIRFVFFGSVGAIAIGMAGNSLLMKIAG